MEIPHTLQMATLLSIEKDIGNVISSKAILTSMKTPGAPFINMDK